MMLRRDGVLFPDKDSEWEQYPSIIDGIQRPCVHLLGGPPGEINLLIVGKGNVSGYGVHALVLLHWTVDEFEYSVTGHGLPTVAYDGTSYIKRARRSKLLDSYRDDVILRPNYSNVQHFAFVGGADCVEVVTQSELTIFALPSTSSRNEWIQDVCEQVRKAFSA